MSRAVAAGLALAALLVLTAVTWLGAREALSPWPLAVISLVKIAIIAAVFLELDRAWPGWALALLGGAAVVLLGAAWWIA